MHFKNNAIWWYFTSEIPHLLQDKDALSALKDGTSMSFLLPYGIEIAKSCCWIAYSGYVKNRNSIPYYTSDPLTASCCSWHAEVVIEDLVWISL